MYLTVFNIFSDLKIFQVFGGQKVPSGNNLSNFSSKDISDTKNGRDNLKNQVLVLMSFTLISQSAWHPLLSSL